MKNSKLAGLCWIILPLFGFNCIIYATNIADSPTKVVGILLSLFVGFVVGIGYSIIMENEARKI